jgi:hypothetical protein
VGKVGCTDECKAAGGGRFLWGLSTLPARASQSYAIKVVAKQASTGVVVLTPASSTSGLHPFNNVATRRIMIKN